MEAIPLIEKQITALLNQNSNMSQLTIVESTIFVKREWIQINSHTFPSFYHVNVRRIMIVGMDSDIVSMSPSV